MSENRVAVEGDTSPECSRYRLLLEITDLVARAQSRPDAFKELAPPGAGPDGRRIAESFSPRPAPGLHADSLLEKEP